MLTAWLMRLAGAGCCAFRVVVWVVLPAGALMVAVGVWLVMAALRWR